MRRERTAEAGTVVAVERRTASIRVTPSRDCHGCELSDRCHKDAEGPLLTWPDASGLSVGDAVTIRTHSGSRILLAMLVYALPLAALIGGAATGDAVGGTSGALIGAASGLATGAGAVFILGRLGTIRRWWDVSVTRDAQPTAESTS